jgi:hypothetical protein
MPILELMTGEETCDQKRFSCAIYFSFTNQDRPAAKPIDGAAVRSEFATTRTLS